jgi:D-serine deaminase-like pyridoxal phosphate-dependent protein
MLKSESVLSASKANNQNLPDDCGPTEPANRMTQIPELSLRNSNVEGDRAYRFAGIDQMLTPFLGIFPDMVDSNIAETIRIAGGDPNRLRPHIKTSKLLSVVRRFVESGIQQCKCATTLELAVACEAGMRDVLVAYPMVGANARRVQEVSARNPNVTVSALVDHPNQIQEWNPSIGIFIDVNPGMDRTGISPEHTSKVVEMVHAITDSGRPFRGLHYYDGHLGSLDYEERRQKALNGYQQLVRLAGSVRDAGFVVGEVITSGSSVFPFASAYPPLLTGDFTLRVSPGAAIYGDFTVQHQLSQFGYRTAALVASRVVSHPRSDLVTCDAGVKAVAVFAGLPNCAVFGKPELVPQRLSEEHLTLQAPAGAAVPEIGEILYLIPRHAGLTVNNFDEAVVVSSDGSIVLERVTARGHESPRFSAINFDILSEERRI